MNNYLYFCNNCSFKKIISGSKDDLENFIMVKSSPIQFTIPSIDYQSGQVRKEKYVKLNKMFKCPKCGFSNKPKLLKDQEENNNDDK